MKRLLLMATALVGFALPASAALQISISDGTTLFTCVDGDGTCDFSGATSNLLTISNVVGNFNIVGTFSRSIFGSQNELSLSNFGITEVDTTQGGTLTFVVSDTSFTAPVSQIALSGSTTFVNDVGPANQRLQFWADPANQQGADPSNTPGTLLFTANGTVTQPVDSFTGTATVPIDLNGPFSMTLGAEFTFIPGASLVGLNQAMITSAPEPMSLAVLGAGLVGLGMARRKRRATVEGCAA